MSSENEKVYTADDKSLEKGVAPGYIVPAGNDDDDRYHFSAVDTDRIAGTIGTGLFLGSGSALSGAGPLGALLAYMLVGTVAYASLCSIGEMTSLAPISGTFPHFAARWVDPALGFAAQAITVPVEVVAAQILISFWDDNKDHAPIYLAVFCVAVCTINIFGARWFGESEFFFSIIKLSLITGLIIAGLVIDLGGGPDRDRLGFRYWKNPGSFARAGLVSHIGADRFIAFLNVFVQAAFSFQGMELVAIAASETENPRRNIARAVRRVFWRILIFYILGILITGMLVPYNDSSLLGGGGTATASPYVIAIRRAGISVLPSVINAGIFTSALSAGNSFLFAASRVLYGLSIRGQAPRIFSYCTKGGIPIASVLFTSCFAFLSFMSVSSGSADVFTWFQSLTTVAGFFTWGTINLTYIRFWAGHRKQGLDRTKLVYYSTLQPGLAIWGLFWTSFFILINGLKVFFVWNSADFVTAYLNVPLFFLTYAGWKIWKRTKFWRSHEMDFWRGIPTIEETEAPEVPPKNLGEKIFNALF
ncbi:general amino acid permease 1 [Amylostereum chailletii]|nr:general amino acid permease 1 [Amylostereum chailletii]